MIHHAITELEIDGLDSIQNWVSLDGDSWLPVDRGPVASDHEQDIARLFNGDGNFKPMVFGRAWLVHWKADFRAGD